MVVVAAIGGARLPRGDTGSVSALSGRLFSIDTLSSGGFAVAAAGFVDRIASFYKAGLGNGKKQR